MVWAIRIFYAFLAQALVGFGWKLLKGLGFGLVAYTGITFFLDQTMSLVLNHLFDVPAGWIGLIKLLKVDVCIKIIFAAYTARAMLWGVNKSGSKTTLTYKG